jgi:CRISPR system Cascade subunit CasE
VYLSRLMLDPSSRTVRRDIANCQALHRTVMALFPQDGGIAHARARYKILHRLEVEAECIILYLQSEVEPSFERLQPGYAVTAPACKKVSGAYAGIQDGMGLRFRLRANPTRKVDTKSGPDGSKRNGRRAPLTTEEQLLAWLDRKGHSGGFRIRTVDISTGGAQARVVGEKTGSELSFLAVMFEGRLIVTDAQAFRETLGRGIGSGKAYGFGLLSVGRG